MSGNWRIVRTGVDWFWASAHTAFVERCLGDKGSGNGAMPASISRLQQRRQKVTAAARSLFVERGFHATGIAQIAETSGVPVQQLYRDFGNKEAIIAAIVEDDIGHLFDKTAAHRTSRGDNDTLTTWLSELLNSVWNTPEPRLLQDIFAEASRNRRIATMFSDLESRVKTAIVAALVRYAPTSASQVHLEETANLVLVLLSGLDARRAADKTLDLPSMIGTVCRIVEGEIARSAATVCQD
jgi:AcrR family transcriptional regulator